MKLRIASMIIFVCGLTLFVSSMFRSQKAEGQPITEPRSFVVHYLVSRSDGNGPPKPHAYYTRAVSAKGEWKETHRSFDGKISTLVGAGDGLYIVNKNSRQLYGPTPVDPEDNVRYSEDTLKKHSQLVKTEQLAGLKTYVIRNEETGTEISHAPETGATPLKVVIRSTPESVTPEFVQEAIDVEFRDLSEDELKAPDLPIRFDLAEKRMQSLRARGLSERADHLQEFIDRFKGGTK